MEVLSLTVLFSALLALLAMVGFAWDYRNRGKDGLDREALRPLEDDAKPSDKTPLS